MKNNINRKTYYKLTTIIVKKRVMGATKRNCEGEKACKENKKPYRRRL